MKKTKEWLNIFCLTAVGLAMILLGYLMIVDTKDLYQARKTSEYIEITEYDYEEIEDESAPAGMRRVFTWDLGEEILHKSHFMSFFFHNYADVYLDGELVYSVKSAAEQAITKTLGGCYVNVPLYLDDVGKEMQVVVTPVYESVKDESMEFYLGSEHELYMMKIKSEADRLALGFIAIIVGFLFLIMEISSNLKKKTDKSLMAIGGFLTMAGFWAVSDTWTAALLFERLSVAFYYMSLIMLLFLVVPLGKYMENCFAKRKWLWMTAYALVITVAIVQVVAQLFRIMDIRETLIMTHTILIGSALLFLFESVKAMIRHEKADKNVRGDYFIICVIGVLLDLIFYYISGDSQKLIFSVLSFTIYFTLTGIGLYKRYKEQEDELEESRVDIMLGQIRPHFIYNTLGTIHYLCLNNPERAASVVEDFSLYLRGSFGELGKKSVIPVSKEISHVQHYVDIEEVRFPDITVMFQLEASDFMLPALSIQPLVENAIKHGLTTKEGGGTVLVRSYETDTHYYVSVEDDGVGFDETTSVKHDGRKHIGISNIEGRVEAMCDGTLTIESTLGEGTKAVICIPKEE